MSAFLGQPDTVVFTAALVLMLLIGAAEAVGLGAAGVEIDADLDGGPLAWLGVGQVPLLVLLVLFLLAFGVGGLAVQQAAVAVTGGTLRAWVAAPVVGVAALPVTGLLARLLAPVLPRDETSAIELDELVGRQATLLVGRAEAGSPARARVTDRYGQAHFVMVEPNAATERFGEGDTVLLVRREGHGFRAIGRGPDMGF
jgi:hypothetical protein